MSSKSGKPTKVVSQNLAVAKKQNIPVQMTDLVLFDDSYVSMKEKFSEEMKRFDQHMFALSKALTTFYDQNMTIQGGPAMNEADDLVDWDDITSSPLVEGEGEDKILNLQFDVSQFRPEEIEVKIADNKILTVSAVHDETSDNSAEHREYHRYFALPRETDPEAVMSTLSREGILTVHAPLKFPEALKALKEHPKERKSPKNN